MTPQSGWAIPPVETKAYDAGKRWHLWLAKQHRYVCRNHSPAPLTTSQRPPEALRCMVCLRAWRERPSVREAAR